MSKDLLDHRLLQDDGDDLELALKLPAVYEDNWPWAAARFINLIVLCKPSSCVFNDRSGAGILNSRLTACSL